VAEEAVAARTLTAKPCSGYRWVILGGATVAQASASFVMQGLGALTGFLQDAFGLTGAAVGLVITVSGLAPVLALLAMGDWLDRRSERRVIVVGAVITALGAIGAALAPGYPALLAGLFVVGIGYSATQPGGSKAVAQWFGRGQRGLAMGIRQAGLPVGGALAAAALPLVTHVWGWRWAFALGAAVALAGGFLFALVYRAPDVASSPGRRPRAFMLLTRTLDCLRQDWMHAVVWSGTTLVSAQFTIQTYLMLFLRDHQHIRLIRGAWMLVVVQLAGVAGRILLAAWSDHRSRSRLGPVAASMLATAAGLAILPILPTNTSTTALYAIAAWLGFFGFGWYGPWVVHVAETSHANATGISLGATMAVNQVAIVVTPPLLGLLHDFAGTYAPLWWAPAAALLVVAPRIARAARKENDQRKMTLQCHNR
jgi:predicted MFS family arabinose efflux permease